MLRNIACSAIISIILLAMPALTATAQSHKTDTLSVSIHFKQSNSNLNLGFMGNKEALDQFVNAYNSHPHKASAIQVVGYASPEGSVAINQRLSQERADVIVNYLKTNCNIPADSIVSIPIGVDWQDLHTAVLADPNVPAREQVLDIITNVTDITSDAHGVLTSQRNKLLKGLENGRTWSYMLKHLYPYLRGSRAEVICIVDQPEPQEAQTPAEHEAPAEAKELDIQPIITPPDTPKESPATAHSTQPAEKRVCYPIVAARSNLLLPLLNVGVEVPVEKHWSVGADYYYPWSWPASDNKNCFELAFFSIEARYWFDASSQQQLPDKNYLVGHSVAPYAAWGYYDFEHDFHGHQGHFWSAGVDYVYALPIMKGRLRMEFQVAVGAVRSPKAQPYNVYEEGGHLIREKGQRKNFNYFGPTKVGVSIVLPINRKVKPSHALAL